MYKKFRLRLAPGVPSMPFGSVGYDAGHLYVYPAVAFLITLLVLIEPSLFVPVLVADLWLLGYHHVIATYTRTAFDREMFHRHWSLMVLLPPALFAAVSGIALSGGALALTTIYIHWQLYHYVRQSEGISKAFASRQLDRDLPNKPAIRVPFYLLPVAAFLTMSSSGASTFLSFPVRLIVLDRAVLSLVWIVTALSLVVAAKQLLQSAQCGALSRQYLHYYLSHLLVFFVAYALIADIMLSWLMANIWHNSQYLAFVWKANQHRFKGKLEPRAHILSTLCQSRNLWLYFTACLTVTAVVYFVAAQVQGPLTAWMGISSLAVAAVVYQTLNFHHYIIDAIIWRRPKPTAVISTVSTAG